VLTASSQYSVVVWVWQRDRHGYHDRGRQSAESWGGSLTLTPGFLNSLHFPLFMMTLTVCVCV